MRLTYFRLKGYAGIYNGLRLDEIRIPFNQFKNNLILIRGGNGFGKSTILSALSLDIDGSDCYRVDAIYQNGDVVFIPYQAEKEIHFCDESGNVFEVLIISPVSNGKRGTTKAYIKKNGEELNPGGNVSSYKDIRNALFDMDPNYIALSMISGESRGLVDKTPAERKQFMGSIVGSLEFFNNAYKNLSKKSSICRSNINNLKSKIYNIGDPDNLYATLAAASAQMDQLEALRDNAKDTISKSQAAVQLLDPDGSIQTLYTELSTAIHDVNTRLKYAETRFDEQFKSFSQSHHLDIAVEKEHILSAMEQIKASNMEAKATLESLTQTKNRLEIAVSSNEVKRTNMQSQIIQENVESIVSDLRDKVEMYGTIVSNFTMDKSLTKDDLIMAKNVVARFINDVENIQHNDEATINKAVEYIHLGKSPSTEASELQSIINDATKTLNVLERDRTKVELDCQQCEVLKHRPATCNDDTCYFIMHAVKFNDRNFDKEFREIDERIIALHESITEAEKAIIFLSDVDKVYNTISNFSIMTVMPLIKRLGPVGAELSNKSLYEIAQMISHHYPFDGLVFEINECFTNIDLLIEHNRNETDLAKYEAKLIIYKNVKDVISDLDFLIAQDQQEIKNIETRISDIYNQLRLDEDRMTSFDKEIKLIESIETAKAECDTLHQEKESLRVRYNQVKDSISKISEMLRNQEKAMQDLNAINVQYGPLKSDIDKMKFNISKLESYRSELDMFMDTAEKIDFLKSACSPTTGIQSIFISIYMNQTIKIANELLGYLFGGTLSLYTPIVDQNNFRIPFTNGVKEIPDISMGSTSQKCMIGMALGCALLSQGSAKYNILRLDEIDGGLDTNNRAQFGIMLLSVMDIMRFKQCIMISHNTEIETYNADVINLDVNGITFSTVSQN